MISNESRDDDDLAAFRLRRYMVFLYDEYYPCGGTNDLLGVFGTVQEAEKAISTHKKEKYPADAYEIYDTKTGEPT